MFSFDLDFIASLKAFSILYPEACSLNSSVSVHYLYEKFPGSMRHFNTNSSVALDPILKLVTAS